MPALHQDSLLYQWRDEDSAAASSIGDAALMGLAQKSNK
jgi:hypothetical protein